MENLRSTGSRTSNPSAGEIISERWQLQPHERDDLLAYLIA